MSQNRGTPAPHPHQATTPPGQGGYLCHSPHGQASRDLHPLLPVPRAPSRCPRAAITKTTKSRTLGRKENKITQEVLTRAVVPQDKVGGSCGGGGEEDEVHVGEVPEPPSVGFQTRSSSSKAMGHGRP